MRSIVRSFIFLFTLLLPLSISAQDTGVIAGRVVDEDGLPVRGIVVRVADTDQQAVTDLSGRYRLGGVPTGSQTLSAEGLGFATAEVTVNVQSGAVNRADITLSAAPLELQGLQVEGQRRGQALAIQQQRTAGNIRSVVAADFIGRFPDPNAAEALQRLPSVIIQRDQGEGRFIQIRGSSPRLTSTSINGTRIPAPEGDIRSVALDVIPADILASIEVSRTWTPNMDGDAIGGSVNLVTKTPQRDLQIADLTVAGGFNDLVEDDIQQLAGTFGQRFGSDQKWGFLASGSYYKTDRGSDNIEMEWGDEDFGSGDQTVLNDLQLRDYLVMRERLGFTGKIDYEFDAQSSFFVEGIFNRFEDQEFRRRRRMRFDDGDFTSPTSSTEATIERELKDRLETQNIWSITGGGTQGLGNAVMDYRLSFSQAEEDEPNRRDINFVQEDIDFTYDVSDPELPRFNVTAGNEFSSTSFEFDELVIENNLTTDQDLVGQLDFTIPFSWGDSPATFQFGGKFTSKTKERDNEITVLDGFSRDLTLDEVAGDFEDTDFFDNEYRVGFLPDPPSTRTFIDQNRSSFEEDTDGTREDSDIADYDADETILAGYVMATFNAGPLQIIPGVRIESWDVDYNSNQVVFDEDGDYLDTLPVSGSTDEVHVLPGVNLRYALRGRTNLRGAVTQSVARPDYFDLAPSQLVNREDEEVELGNTELEATTSTNLDLLFEHYFQSIGVFSGGFFYKSIDDAIFTRVFDLNSGTFAGFEAVQPVNGGSADLWGLEFAWDQSLSFLPGALNGLSVHANYTYTDASTDFTGRPDIAFPGQAANSGNVAVGYERFGFSGRLALTFRDEYLDEVGEEAADDIFIDSHAQLDLSAAIRLHPRAQLFVEMINLTDEPLQAYQGTPDRPIQREFYSWWGHIGFKFNAF